MLAAMVRLAKQHSSSTALILFVNRLSASTTKCEQRIFHNKCYAMRRNGEQQRFQRLHSSSHCWKSSSTTSHTSSFSAFAERSTTGEQMDDFFEEHNKPSKLRFGLLKVITTILFGVYFGAFLAKLGANLLEEYEIFVHGDDDDN